MNFYLCVHVDAPIRFIINLIDFFTILHLWVHVGALGACCGCIGCMWVHLGACGCILAVAVEITEYVSIAFLLKISN